MARRTIPKGVSAPGMSLSAPKVANRGEVVGSFWSVPIILSKKSSAMMRLSMNISRNRS